MNNNEYSRRDFLKAFAALSTAPLLVNMLSGCGSDAYPGAAYGPGPVGLVVVSMMDYLDQSNRVVLWGNQNVQVHTAFGIYFNNVLMNVATVEAAITFTDANSNPVAFTTSADQNAQYSTKVVVTPTADLAHNTNYILSVNDTATDSNGTRLMVNVNASASFKTAA